MIQSLRSGEEAKTTQTVVVREQKSHKLMIPLAITCGILLTVVGFLGAHFFGKESPPPVAVVSPPPPAIMVPDRGKEPPVMNRKEPSPELPVEANGSALRGLRFQTLTLLRFLKLRIAKPLLRKWCPSH